MRVTETNLPGVVIIEPRVFEDDRGFFMETYNQREFETAGLPDTFVQDNHSRSARGVLRGLHFQFPQWQGKLVRVTEGEIFDVAVDIRPESARFGEWIGVTLSGANRHQLYIPEGFAHGFCVLSDTADVLYKCTSLYKPEDDKAIRWDDPDIGIGWPIANPEISPKDARGLFLRDLWPGEPG